MRQSQDQTLQLEVDLQLLNQSTGVGYNHLPNIQKHRRKLYGCHGLYSY
jgi:hypothetical protein